MCCSCDLLTCLPGRQCKSAIAASGENAAQPSVKMSGLRLLSPAGCAVRRGAAGPVHRPLPPLQAIATAGPDTGTANGAQTSYITVSGLPDYYEVLGVRFAAWTLIMRACGS